MIQFMFMVDGEIYIAYGADATKAAENLRTEFREYDMEIAGDLEPFVFSSPVAPSPVANG